MIAEELNVDKETVRQILTENLKTKKVCAKMVPKNLSEDQKLNREEMCQNVLEKTEDPDFLNSVVTCDETWLFQYDPETKRQSMQWKTTLSKTKKGTNVKIQDQDNARRFLRYSRNYYDSVRTTWSNRESDELH
jgi:predicted transcriptional regulator